MGSIQNPIEDQNKFAGKDDKRDSRSVALLLIMDSSCRALGPSFWGEFLSRKQKIEIV